MKPLEAVKQNPGISALIGLVIAVSAFFAAMDKVTWWWSSHDKAHASEEVSQENRELIQRQIAINDTLTRIIEQQNTMQVQNQPVQVENYPPQLQNPPPKIQRWYDQKHRWWACSDGDSTWWADREGNC